MKTCMYWERLWAYEFHARYKNPHGCTSCKTRVWEDLSTRKMK